MESMSQMRMEPDRPPTFLVACQNSASRIAEESLAESANQIWCDDQCSVNLPSLQPLKVAMAAQWLWND